MLAYVCEKLAQDILCVHSRAHFSVPRSHGSFEGSERVLCGFSLALRRCRSRKRRFYALSTLCVWQLDRSTTFYMKKHFFVVFLSASPSPHRFMSFFSFFLSSSSSRLAACFFSLNLARLAAKVDDSVEAQPSNTECACARVSVVCPSVVFSQTPSQ